MARPRASALPADLLTPPIVKWSYGHTGGGFGALFGSLGFGLAGMAAAFRIDASTCQSGQRGCWEALMFGVLAGQAAWATLDVLDIHLNRPRAKALSGAHPSFALVPLVPLGPSRPIGAAAWTWFE